MISKRYFYNIKNGGSKNISNLYATKLQYLSQLSKPNSQQSNFLHVSEPSCLELRA